MPQPDIILCTQVSPNDCHCGHRAVIYADIEKWIPGQARDELCQFPNLFSDFFINHLTFSNGKCLL